MLPLLGMVILVSDRHLMIQYLEPSGTIRTQDRAIRCMNDHWVPDCKSVVVLVESFLRVHACPLSLYKKY